MCCTQTALSPALRLQKDSVADFLTAFLNSRVPTNTLMHGLVNTSHTFYVHIYIHTHVHAYVSSASFLRFEVSFLKGPNRSSPKPQTDLPHTSASAQATRCVPSTQGPENYRHFLRLPERTKRKHSEGNSGLTCLYRRSQSKCCKHEQATSILKIDPETLQRVRAGEIVGRILL